MFSIQAVEELQKKGEGSDGTIGHGQQLIPDFINMTKPLSTTKLTAKIFEAESVQLLYNITNIKPNVIYADPETFFLRAEEKYGLNEINVEKIDLNFTLDYKVLMIPPVFVDEGTISFFCEDVSLNSVWRLDLNTTKNFFDVVISHVLV